MTRHEMIAAAIEGIHGLAPGSIKNPNAVALGSIKSPRKSKASAENGKKGGRPKNVKPLRASAGRMHPEAEAAPKEVDIAASMFA